MAKKSGSWWPWILGGAAVVGGVAWAVKAYAKPALMTKEETKNLVNFIISDMKYPGRATLDREGLVLIENAGKDKKDMEGVAKAILASLKMRPDFERVNPYGIFIRASNGEGGGNLPAYWDLGPLRG